MTREKSESGFAEPDIGDEEGFWWRCAGCSVLWDIPDFAPCAICHLMRMRAERTFERHGFYKAIAHHPRREDLIGAVKYQQKNMGSFTNARCLPSSVTPLRGGCVCYLAAPTVPVFRDPMTHLLDCPARKCGWPVGAVAEGART